MPTRCEQQATGTQMKSRRVEWNVIASSVPNAKAEGQASNEETAHICANDERILVDG